MASGTMYPHSKSGEVSEALFTGDCGVYAFIWTPGSSSAQIIVYDNTSASGTVLFSAKGYPSSIKLEGGVVTTGIFVVQTGAGSHFTAYLDRSTTT